MHDLLAELDAIAGASLGARPTAATRVRGGDVADAWRVGLDDGRSVFVKQRRTPSEDGLRAFEREADGLAWLREADAIRLPEVVLADDDAGVLVLEWIESAPPAPDHDERLGRELAALHAVAPASFGFPTDNVLATLPQQNQPTDSWPAFYGEHRLRPLARRAVDAGHLSSSFLARLDALVARLDHLCGPAEPPARLHGDLWAGNAITDEHGRPVLVDPAVYGGHREVDLAMMRLFGGFSSRVFAAYHDVFPLASGHAERVELYQLYPLLAHVNLFPAHGYQAAAERVVAHLS